jgi:hypothetical protein
MEKLTSHRLRRYGKKMIKEYLVEWKGYGPEYSEWYGEDLLGDAKSLISEYEGTIP